MAILAECPMCHRKQSVKNKACKCGADMDKSKRQKKKVKYWIDFKIPGGKKRRETVGFSIEEARDADGKRRGQKRENRIFDILPDSRMTFLELTEWYLGLDSVKELRACDRVQLGLRQGSNSHGSVRTTRSITISLTVQRSGRLTRTWRTGCSAWCERTSRPRSMAASA